MIELHFVNVTMGLIVGLVVCIIFFLLSWYTLASESEEEIWLQKIMKPKSVAYLLLFLMLGGLVGTGCFVLLLIQHLLHVGI